MYGGYIFVEGPADLRGEATQSTSFQGGTVRSAPCYRPWSCMQSEQSCETPLIPLVVSEVPIPKGIEPKTRGFQRRYWVGSGGGEGWNGLMRSVFPVRFGSLGCGRPETSASLCKVSNLRKYAEHDEEYTRPQRVAQMLEVDESFPRRHVARGSPLSAVARLG